MAFVDDIKKYVDKGISASKDVFSKAGTQASHFGDQGVKRVELLQLSNRLTHEYSQLGEAVYEALTEGSSVRLSASSEQVASFLEKISALKVSIAEREEALKTAQMKSEENSKK